MATESNYDLIIIGAGAGGLCLNAQLAKAGLKVLLLDRQARSGRKLLLSGGGKCNVTNLSINWQNYIGQNPQFCEPALTCLSPQNVLDFLDEHKLAWEERELGQIFLKRGAEQLRDLFVLLGKENGSTPMLGKDVKSIRQKDGLFQVKTKQEKFVAPKLVIATGSPAWPTSGASDTGFDLAARLGHSIISPKPALTPLGMPSNWALAGLAGINLFIKISLPGLRAKQYALPLLITHQGISGPAALQISSWWEKGQVVAIDWLPGDDCESLFNQPGAGKLLLANFLSRQLPARLVKALIPEELASRKVAELSRMSRDSIYEAIHNHLTTPEPPDFSRAEACAGGVNTDEINPYTLESLLVPGLYFVGEVMDVCGELGGYNLHWAWASAKFVARESL